MSVVSKLENYLKQLSHPFYKRVDDFRNEVKIEALLKAAEKYPEPFNPHSWTSRQLAKHAMAENYDQSNYIVGLYEKCVDLEEQIDDLTTQLELAQDRADNNARVINNLMTELKQSKNEAEYWRLRAAKVREWELKYRIATSTGEECNAYQKQLLDFYEANKTKGVFIDERV